MPIKVLLFGGEGGGCDSENYMEELFWNLVLVDLISVTKNDGFEIIFVIMSDGVCSRERSCFSHRALVEATFEAPKCLKT